MLNKDQVLYAFKAWGFRLKSETDTQYFGTCPFCTKDKFYLNKIKALWDCKVCGVSGNYFQYLERVLELSKKQLGDAEMKALCIDRKLPRQAFRFLEMGYWGKKYVIAVRGEMGRLLDLRSYVIGEKVKSTIGCHVGLLGVKELINSDYRIPVFVCEGEWDKVSLEWLLGFNKKPGVVVAVPGASTFKREWSVFFQNRDVFACYDNDPAGENGEITIQERMTGVAQSVKYLHWSPGLPTGFDLRDFITADAIKAKKPLSAYKLLMTLFKASPRRRQEAVVPAAPGAGEPAPEAAPPPVKTTLKEVKDVFAKWLYLKDLTPVEVMLTTVMSQWIQGDPLWMFLVAPPGGSKTELINSLSTLESVYFTSTLTPHALISGAPLTFGKDPSLIPQLNGKVLAIKDFTTVLDGRETDKEEIFGILRDAYDGHCGKVFGNGIRRTYKSSFTIISGVTEKIYKQGSHQQALGERFLKYSIESSLNRPHEEDVLTRAISNLTHETEMRGQISDTTKNFVNYMITRVPEDPRKYPKIPNAMKPKVVALAMYGARMRGVVARDKFRVDMIDSRPSAEMGTRLSKQLAKFLISLAFVRGHEEVKEEDYDVAKKLMLDTISQRNEDIVCSLLQRCPGQEDTLKTRDLSFLTNYTQSTVARVLADMQMLGIVERRGKANSYEWTLSKYMRDLVTKADLYKTEREVKRPKVFTGRVKVNENGKFLFSRKVTL